MTVVRKTAKKPFFFFNSNEIPYGIKNKREEIIVWRWENIYGNALVVIFLACVLAMGLLALGAIFKALSWVWSF